jgi:4-hydroxy-tetrahydrodipicolinate synthase
MAIDAPFGRMITAMVTPFNKDGAVDWDGVAKLAQHLVDTGHDAIAVMAQPVKHRLLNLLRKSKSLKLLNQQLAQKSKLSLVLATMKLNIQSIKLSALLKLVPMVC